MKYNQNDKKRVKKLRKQKKQHEQHRQKQLQKQEKESLKLRQEQIREQTKQKRKRRKKNHILSYIILAVIVLIVGITLSCTVFFKISAFDIKAEGAEKEKIIDQSGIQIGDNLIFINTSKAEQSILKQNILYDEVKVKRSFPSTVIIEAEIAKTAFVIESGNSYYYVSKNNRIIDKKAVGNLSYMTIYGEDLSKAKVGDYIDQKSDKLSLAKRVTELTNKKGIGKVSAIDVTDISNIKLYIQGKYLIRFGNESGMDYKLDDIKKIVSEKLQTDAMGEIDATITGKIFFKPTATPPTPTSESEKAEESESTQASSEDSAQSSGESTEEAGQASDSSQDQTSSETAASSQGADSSQSAASQQ